MLRRLLPLLFACLLMLLPAGGAYAAPIAQQTATSYEGIVNTTANIRSGPGLQYPVVDQAQSGQLLTIVACNDDCTWLQLDNGNWIAAFLVDLVGESSSESGSESNGESNSESSDTNSGNTRSRIIDPDDLTLNPPSEAALDIVEQILSYTGLPQSFEVYSANIYNAAAMMVNRERVILYDPQLIADIENVTDHDWPAVSIFAHEIGHHLAGHTLSETYVRTFELEADYFSGYILHKMGATLEEAQSVVSLLRDHANMTDHPPQAERLVAVENGWQESARQDGLATWEPNFPSFTDEVAPDAATSYAPAEGAGILAVLKQASDARMLAESQAARFALHHWELGLRALVGEHPTGQFVE